MSKRSNILYIVHRVPYPPNRGDRIRSYHLLSYLARRANVHLATLNDEPLEPGTVGALERLCRQVAIEPLDKRRWLRAAGSLARGHSATVELFSSPRLRETIQRWSTTIRFDAVFVFCSSMAPYLDVQGLANVPVVMDLVDVDSQKFADYAATSWGPKAWLYGLEARRVRQLERFICQRAQAVTLVSEAEADILRQICPNDNTTVVKNGVDLEYFRPASDVVQRERCVFVGALDYLPNVQGIGWFCREVWPRVIRLHPAATLEIVGRNPVASVRSLSTLAGVRVVGTVPDVRPHLSAASVAVIPLQIARGIQNKVLEALAMAKPVIASPGALEGLGVTPGEHVIAARSTSEWVEALEGVFGDPPMAAGLGNAGRRFVEAEHNWETCLSPLDELLPLKGESVLESIPVGVQ